MRFAPPVEDPAGGGVGPVLTQKLPQRDVEFRVLRSRLNHAIWEALREASVTIAYPQIDVHFDPPVHAALAAVAENAD